MRDDVIWNRPSWPLKGNPYKIIEQINTYFSENLEEFADDKNSTQYFDKLLDEQLTMENKALSNLNLKLPLSLEKLKKNYKKLVKIFHPDVNGNNKKAEDKFKEINKSYKILLEKFKNDKNY